MTAIIYFGEMVVALMLAIFLLATSTSSMGEAVALFSGGVVALTLGEYMVHRFLLHNIATTQHRIHHAHPDEAIDKIFWQIWVCFAVVYLIAGGVVLAGALAAYAWYLFIHYCAHHSSGILPPSLLKHHSDHHAFANRNYGVTTTLWDHVFRTMFQ
jgi:sterol desaturase/sphingolipid hydroxylase (fatty acid hydroxylase superfamily)